MISLNDLNYSSEIQVLAGLTYSQLKEDMANVETTIDDFICYNFTSNRFEIISTNVNLLALEYNIDIQDEKSFNLAIAEIIEHNFKISLELRDLKSQCKSTEHNIIDYIFNNEYLVSDLHIDQDDIPLVALLLVRKVQRFKELYVTKDYIYNIMNSFFEHKNEVRDYFKNETLEDFKESVKGVTLLMADVNLENNFKYLKKLALS